MRAGGKVQDRAYVHRAHGHVVAAAHVAVVHVAVVHGCVVGVVHYFDILFL